MGTASPKVDTYIEKAAPFARPILTKLRRLFHQAAPEIEEAIKWGFPNFVHQGIVGSMAAFKEHVSYGFWKAKLLDDPESLFTDVGDSGMAMTKVRSLSDLPPDRVLLRYIRAAVALNEAGVKVERPRRARPGGELPIPEDLLAAMNRNRKALKTFEAFSPSRQREYLEWVTEAKRNATRQRRITAAVEWMAEGKPRNWKYMKPTG